jgi:F0F1-type ATP synthase membrane subunit b/b'
MDEQEQAIQTIKDEYEKKISDLEEKHENAISEARSEVREEMECDIEEAEIE